MVDNTKSESDVSKWLEHHGCHLEFKTFGAFTAADLRPHLWRYVESKEGVPREIDVSISRSVVTKSKRYGIAGVCCECKHSDEPWIMMTTGRQSVGNVSNLSCLPALNRAEGFVDLLKCVPKNETIHFRRQQSYEDSLLQMRSSSSKKDCDLAFDALRKVSNAAWDIARQCDDVAIVIPCIVLEGQLFRAGFDIDAGRFNVSRAEFGRVLWEGCDQGTLVDIVQVDHLSIYAQGLKKSLSIAESIVAQL